MGAVSAACIERGLRLTPLRQRVLELIAHEHRPVKAYDLLDKLRGERNGAAPPTVYRALDFLLEHGFIHKLESVNAYLGCHHPNERHTVPFLICDVCTGATELCDDRVSSMLIEEAKRVGFLPEAQTLEVHGICSRCRETDAAR
jgi:Fur family transcriptional regulator, zinc uptake regulator